MKKRAAASREKTSKTLYVCKPAPPQVLESMRKGEPISRNINDQLEDSLTLGQRVADRVAFFGGSWTFIGLFVFFLAAWVTVNTLLLLNRNHTFDPYPFILLNLFLSMIAALQAPVIMMSQNRQAEHDRLNAEHDYEVNLKAELEIEELHQKIDEMRKEQTELVKAVCRLIEEKEQTR